MGPCRPRPKWVPGQNVYVYIPYATPSHQTDKKQKAIHRKLLGRPGGNMVRKYSRMGLALPSCRVPWVFPGVSF